MSSIGRNKRKIVKRVAFRAPRRSDTKIDDQNKVHYRRHDSDPFASQPNKRRCLGDEVIIEETDSDGSTDVDEDQAFICGTPEDSKHGGDSRGLGVLARVATGPKQMRNSSKGKPCGDHMDCTIYEPEAISDGALSGPVGVRIKLRFIFCTWPRCNTLPGIVINAACALFGSKLEYAVVCREKHKDGCFHLHGLFVMHPGKIYSTRSNRGLDSLAGKHGNYQKVRSLYKVLKYVLKGGHYEEYGVDAKKLLRQLEVKQSSEMVIIAHDLYDGKSVADISTRENAHKIMMHLGKLRDYELFCRANEKLVLPPFIFPLDDSSDSIDNQLRVWVRKNLHPENLPRPMRQKHLWLWGDSRLGKTIFSRTLSAHFRTYVMPSKDFFSGWNNRAKLVLMDEYRSRDLDFMKQFLGGWPMQLHVHGSNVMKTSNPACILMSNKSPAECYPNEVGTSSYNAFLNRLLVLHVTEPINALKPAVPVVDLTMSD